MKSEEHQELINVLRATNEKLDSILGVLLSANTNTILEHNTSIRDARKALEIVKSSSNALSSKARAKAYRARQSVSDVRLKKILAHEFWSSHCLCNEKLSYRKPCKCLSYLKSEATFSDFIDVLISKYGFNSQRSRSAADIDLMIRARGITKFTKDTRSFYRRASGARFHKFKLKYDDFYQFLAVAGLDKKIIGVADKYYDICIYRVQLDIATPEEAAEAHELMIERYRDDKKRRGLR